MSEQSCYDCEEAFRRLGDYLDRELTQTEIFLVREHLETCQHCAMEFKFEESLLIELKAKARQSKAPPDLLASVLKTLDEAQSE